MPQMPAGCQGGGVGHDVVGSSSCRGWQFSLCLHTVFCLALGAAGCESLLCRQKPKRVRAHIYFRVGNTALGAAVKIETE